MSKPTPPRPPASSSGKTTQDGPDAPSARPDQGPNQRPDQGRPVKGRPAKGADDQVADGARKRAGSPDRGTAPAAARDDATQRLDAGATSDTPPPKPATARGPGAGGGGTSPPVTAPPAARTRPVPSSSVGGGRATAAATPPAPVAPAPVSGQLVRRRAVLRKLDPWSVLKLSLIFYFCALLVVMLALAVFWAIINQLGLIDRLLDFLAELQVIVEIRAGMIARAVFLLGLLNVVLWSGINVFLAFLYNLIADLVGGLKMTLVEEA